MIDQAGSLEALLAEYPWPEEWAKLGRPVELFWTFDVAAERLVIWRFIADTSALNQALGLPVVTYVEVDGLRHGSLVSGGQRSEWVERPWVWRAERQMTYEREFTRGYAHFLRARTILEEGPDGGTRLHIYTGLIARNAVGRFLYGLAMRTVRGKFERKLNQLSELADAGRSLVSLTTVPPLSDQADKALDELRGHLSGAVDERVIDKLLGYIRRAPDVDVYRLRVVELADRWNVDRTDLLLACLHATRRGVLRLTWDVVCPHCRGVRDSLETLGDLPTGGDCTPCGIEFETQAIDALEVTFHVHPAVRNVDEVLFCAAEPARRLHIKVQESVAPGRSKAIDWGVEPGRYRIRLQGEKRYGELVVGPAGDTGDGGRVRWEASAETPRLTMQSDAALELVNDGEGWTTFVIEESEADRQALRPAAVFALQTFRDLFSEQALASGVTLDVGTQTLLFTDVVGSTRFYLEHGDGVAFAEVRKKFVVAYDVVRQHEGVVVKTIGDAVMAAFHDPRQALAAAMQMQERLGGHHEECALRIRISLHSGPCIAVNLNSGVDYFGNSVNLAAKIQAVAEAGQIAFTESVMKDAEVVSLLRESGLEPETVECKVGTGSVTAYRVTID